MAVVIYDGSAELVVRIKGVEGKRSKCPYLAPKLLLLVYPEDCSCQ